MREARRLNIPLIGLVDTNCDPDEVDLVSRATTTRSGRATLICRVLADAVIEGRGPQVTEEELAAEGEETDSIEEAVAEALAVAGITTDDAPAADAAAAEAPAEAAPAAEPEAAAAPAEARAAAPAEEPAEAPPPRSPAPEDGRRGRGRRGARRRGRADRRGDEGPVSDYKPSRRRHQGPARAHRRRHARRARRARRRRGRRRRRVQALLRERGIAKAAKRGRPRDDRGQDRRLHPRRAAPKGVLVEVRCETDFVANSETFAEFVKDMPLQIVSSDDTRWVPSRTCRTRRATPSSRSTASRPRTRASPRTVQRQDRRGPARQVVRGGRAARAAVLPRRDDDGRGGARRARRRDRREHRASSASRATSVGGS